MIERPIQALLFDFDGTLLDTNELITQSFLAALGEKFPGKYNREAVLPFNGPSLRETFTEIAPSMVDELIALYRKWNLEMHDELVTEFDGVSETLKLLKTAGIRLAIVSTKVRSTIDRGLELMDAKHIFDVIVAGDDVKNPKPDPESIYLALHQLGIEKEEALMIGDNYHDIEAGKNAGVRTAGVAWSAKGEQFLATFEPDYMLQYISDVLKLTRVDRK